MKRLIMKSQRSSMISVFRVALLIAIAIMPAGFASASDVKFAGEIVKLVAPVTLRYRTVDGAYSKITLETRTWVNKDSETTVVEAEFEVSAKSINGALHWNIDLVKLKQGSTEFSGSVPVITLQRVTDNKGRVKRDTISYPLLKKLGKPEPLPGSDFYRSLNSTARRQGGTLLVLPDKPLNEGDLLYTVNARDMFTLPVEGLTTSGGSEGRIRGATKYQGRDALVVEILGALTVKGASIDLAGDVRGYRIIDQETSLLLASVTSLVLVGKIHGEKGGITLTRSVNSRLK